MEVPSSVIVSCDILSMLCLKIIPSALMESLFQVILNGESSLFLQPPVQKLWVLPAFSSEQEKCEYSLNTLNVWGISFSLSINMVMSSAYAEIDRFPWNGAGEFSLGFAIMAPHIIQKATPLSNSLGDIKFWSHCVFIFGSCCCMFVHSFDRYNYIIWETKTF